MRPVASALIALSLFALPASLAAETGPWQDAGKEQVADVQDDREATDATESAEDKAKAEEEKLVCKNLPVTGTRFKERFCRTASEWERIRNGMKEVAQEMRRDGARRVEEDPNNPGSGFPTADPQ